MPPDSPANVAGDRERQPLVGADVDADRIGAQRRVATGAQRHAERREHHSPQQQQRAEVQRQREVVVDGRGTGPGGGPDADQPVVAAGEVVPLEDDGVDDLGERQREHGQVDAGQAHAEPAEQQRASQRHHRRHRERHAHRHGEMLDGEPGAIGAEPEIGGVAERHHAARAHDEVQAGREQCEAKNLDQQELGVAADHRRQQQQGEHDRAGCEPRALASRPQHRLRSMRCLGRELRRCRAGPRAAPPAPPP